MLTLRIVASTIALACAGGAVAQPLMEEEDLALAYGGKDFVSIATGNRQLLRNAPSAATVVTAEDIAAMGATTLDEVMETIPGVHVGHAANTAYPQYTFRGIFSNYNPQVLVLENGIPMTSQVLGERGAGSLGLPLEHVARIEVIRGPGSALYGADAYAGVINVITKSAAEVGGTQLGARAGSFDSWDGWFSHGGQAGLVSVSAHLQVSGTEGHRENIQVDRIGGNGPVNIGRNGVDGNLGLAYGKLQWRLGYRKRDDIGTFAGVFDVLDRHGETRTERVTSDLTWHDEQFARDLSLTLQAAHFHYKEFSDLTILPAGAAGPGFPGGIIGNPYKWERQGRYSASTVYSGLAGHRIRAGLGYDRLDLHKTRETKNFTFVGLVPTPTPGAQVLDFSDTAPFLRPHLREVKYAYLQDEWSLARDWTLTAGVRYDHYSDFGATTNPRLALVWEARHDLTEAYSINNPVQRGNPALQPEKISTLEAALAWQFRPDARLGLNLFHHRMTDIIRTVSNADPATGATNQNIGEQTGHGGELEAVWDASHQLRLSGHYAYQKNVDEQTRNDAGYAPHHHFYARADWRFAPGWQLNSQVNHVADRNRAFGDNRAQIPDYTVVHLTLRIDRPRQGWDFAASVRNLFDADVREPSLSGSGITYDLPMPGRSFWLQARYSL